MRTPPFPRETILQPAGFHCRAVPLTWHAIPPCPSLRPGQGFPLPWITSSPNPAKGNGQHCWRMPQPQPHCLPPSSITTPPQAFWPGSEGSGCERPQPGWGRHAPTPVMGRGRFAPLPPPAVLVLPAAPHTACFGLWVHATW